MRFDIMTLFPDVVECVLGESIIGRARKSGAIGVYTHNIRDYSEDKHRRVDDSPYGGGRGMLMSAPPVCACWDAVSGITSGCGSRRTVFMSPRGAVLTQAKAAELAEEYDSLIILCGHYEGVDERAIEEIVDEEISIGDYILTGGELPACVLVECVARHIRGVLPDEECYRRDSISCGMLEYPQYTRPASFRGRDVPEVLLSGNHKKIEDWRQAEAERITALMRPDLLDNKKG